MPNLYSNGDAIQEIADRLMGTWHPELATAIIKYVFRDKAANEAGRPVYGKATKLSGVNEHLIAANFVIEVALDKWQDLDNDARDALVDHLMEHCTGEEDEENGGAMKWKLRKPDMKEFTTILQRRGIWHDAMNEFVAAAQAISLDTIEREVQEETAAAAAASVSQE